MLNLPKTSFRSLFPPKLMLFFSVAGPGLVVMLADTDAGSIITAAQSGAQWGYKLLALQFILIPILFIAQELTLRLGLVTGMGHGELIRKQFGSCWAWLSVATLLISCIGAIITELSGIAGVGLIYGIPTWLSAFGVVVFLIIIVWTGSYLSVERIALGLGAFELVFLFVAWQAQPDPHAILADLKQWPLHNPDYLYLCAANIGAVIMPWMIFYQQSAVLDKGLGHQHLPAARWDTALGAIVTQLIMSAVLITTAATLGKSNPGAALNNVQEISSAITPFLGKTVGQLLFALGIIGAALVAAIVVSLTAAWGLGEITGYRRSLQDHPKEAPWFYTTYIVILIIGGCIVSSGINLINLSVAIEVMNTLLLPIVLGFLYLLAVKTLPKQYRLRGAYAIFVGVVLLVTTLFGLGAGLWGIFN